MATFGYIWSFGDMQIQSKSPSGMATVPFDSTERWYPRFRSTRASGHKSLSIGSPPVKIMFEQLYWLTSLRIFSTVFLRTRRNWYRTIHIVVACSKSDEHMWNPTTKSLSLDGMKDFYNVVHRFEVVQAVSDVPARQTVRGTHNVHLKVRAVGLVASIPVGLRDVQRRHLASLTLSSQPAALQHPCTACNRDASKITAAPSGCSSSSRSSAIPLVMRS